MHKIIKQQKNYFASDQRHLLLLKIALRKISKVEPTIVRLYANSQLCRSGEKELLSFTVTSALAMNKVCYT